jgi:hypothetical protein
MQLKPKHRKVAILFSGGGAQREYGDIGHDTEFLDNNIPVIGVFRGYGNSPGFQPALSEAPQGGALRGAQL